MKEKEVRWNGVAPSVVSRRDTLCNRRSLALEF